MKTEDKIWGAVLVMFAVLLIGSTIDNLSNGNERQEADKRLQFDNLMGHCLRDRAWEFPNRNELHIACQQHVRWLMNRVKF